MEKLKDGELNMIASGIVELRLNKHDTQLSISTPNDSKGNLVLQDDTVIKMTVTVKDTDAPEEDKESTEDKGLLQIQKHLTKEDMQQVDEP